MPFLPTVEKINFANIPNLDCTFWANQEEDLHLVDQICTLFGELMTSFYGYLSAGDLSVAGFATNIFAT